MTNAAGKELLQAIVEKQFADGTFTLAKALTAVLALAQEEKRAQITAEFKDSVLEALDLGVKEILPPLLAGLNTLKEKNDVDAALAAASAEIERRQIAPAKGESDA